ncbi:MAG: transporter substrate-binding domain-containing protein [Clostridia bacterium]|nr:transporter substrate-binding domain-containing protein [Clostridia bacterium]
MKKLTCTILIFSMLACLLLSGCSSTCRTVDDVIKSGKLVVATNAEFAPFEYRDIKSGQIVGIDIDIIRAYAKYLGVQCVISDMDFDGTFLSVYSNKADLAVAGITVNAKRQRAFNFSVSYYTSAQVIVVQKDSPLAAATSAEEIRQLLSQSKATVGSQMGTIGEYYASGSDSWNFEPIPNVVSRAFDTGALACNALSNGQIDAVIIDQAPAKLLAQKFENIVVLDIVLTSEEYAIALQKGNDTLTQSLNDFINQIKTDGTLEEILLKYYE